MRTPSWFDLRLILGVTLVVCSVLLGALVVSRADRTEPTIAATHDLSIGTVLTAQDLRVVRVKLGSTEQDYVTSAAQAVGRTLTRPLGQGELLPRASVAATPTTDTTVPISVSPQNAPELDRGQRIGVWVSTSYCEAVLVLGDVTVQAVRNTGSGLSASGDESVVVRVSTPLAARVFGALGLPGAVIRLGVLSGAPDPHANDALPSLGPCTHSPSS